MTINRYERRVDTMESEMLIRETEAATAAKRSNSTGLAFINFPFISLILRYV